jgi:hypothetical protein
MVRAVPTTSSAVPQERDQAYDGGGEPTGRPIRYPTGADIIPTYNHPDLGSATTEQRKRGAPESMTVIDDWNLHVHILEHHRIVGNDVAVARWHSREGRTSARDPTVSATGRACTTSTFQR